MIKDTLRIGDVIIWGTERKTVNSIQDGYAVWYGDVEGRRVMIARCHIQQYPDEIQIVEREGLPHG